MKSTSLPFGIDQPGSVYSHVELCHLLLPPIPGPNYLLANSNLCSLRLRPVTTSCLSDINDVLHGEGQKDFDVDIFFDSYNFIFLKKNNGSLYLIPDYIMIFHLNSPRVSGLQPNKINLLVMYW